MMFSSKTTAALLVLATTTIHGFTAFRPSLLSRVNVASTARTAPFFAAATAEDDLDMTRKIVMQQEDLERTREVIMSHIDKLSGDESADESTDESTGDTEAPEQRPLMVRTALGEKVERTPVWLFRQAGRHLPEYHEYKEKVGRNFLEMLDHPEDVAECTLQPLRRYELDAAILFSDILVIPQAFGMEVIMPGGVGIQVPEIISTPEDFSKYTFDEDPAVLVATKLSHVTQSVELIKKKMTEEGFDHLPLIGFSATPFTLMFYMVGGSSKKNPDAGMDFLDNYPEESSYLLNTLTDIVIEYLVAQVEKGADMIQLFEAMGMMIDEKHFLDFELACLERIGRELKERVGDKVPIMMFARGASYANSHLAALDIFNVITIDGEASRSTIRSTLPPNTILQGNYDPKELILTEDMDKTPLTVRSSVKSYLDEIGCTNLIANLGEGLGGKECPSLVREFVNAVHEYSEEVMKSD